MELSSNKSNNKPFQIFSILAVSLVLGLCFDYFFYKKELGLSFLAYVLLILTGILFICYVYKNKNVKTNSYLLIIPILFFATMVFVRSNAVLSFLNIVASLLLILVLALSITKKNISDYLLIDYIALIFKPFQFIPAFLKTIADASTLNKDTKGKDSARQIIRGILVTIPIIVIFSFLFSSADLVFNKYFYEIFNNIDISSETVFRITLIFFVTSFFIGAYSYTFREKYNSEENKDIKKLSQNQQHLEVVILLTSLNTLFLLFLIIQVKYFFGGAPNISLEGFTYAEYARKGFFELIVVTVLSLLILWAVENAVPQDGKHRRPFKLLSAFLIIQVFFIMASSFMRLSLYEEAYGFTSLRVYSHSFILWLAVIFIFFLYKIFIDRTEKKFLFNSFISLIIYLSILNIFNPDAFIAKQNIKRFLISGELDMGYIDTLSYDTLPQMVRVLELDTDNKEIAFNEFKLASAEVRDGVDVRTALNIDELGQMSAKEKVIIQLFVKLNRLEAMEENWQSINMSRLRAEKLLLVRIAQLKQSNQFNELIQKLE